VVTSTHAGFPVLDGIPVFLRGVRALFTYRDFLQQGRATGPSCDAAVADDWRQLLRGAGTRSEMDSLQMLSAFGLPTARVASVHDEASALAVAEDLGYPLVLKTAVQGILHKSDQGGVVVGIESAVELRSAYQDMAGRLGPEALIAEMADDGVEMILGVRRDPQFGPIVLLGFGGVYAETLQDVCFALPPFSAAHAKRCVDRLKLRPLLDGVRGAPAADIVAFCELAAGFSAMVDALRDVLEEIDVNPVIVHEDGCTIVDALVVAK
jgi:acyl-CoA synthetase (NDP forming)